MQNKKMLEEIKGLSPQDSINHLFSRFLNSIMETEREIFLDNQQDENKGNGYYNRNIINDTSKLSLRVPRDRNSDFRPVFLPDEYKRVYEQSYEELLSSFVVNGYSKASIASTLKAIGLPYNQEELDKLTDKIHTEAVAFNTRELPEQLFCILVDGYRCELKDSIDGKIKTCVIYIILSIDEDGKKDVAGYYPVFGNESTQTWKDILHSLINRGLKKIALIISDDFTGLKEVIPGLFPKTDHQLCFVHMQRNITRNLPRDVAKKFNQKLIELRTSSDDKSSTITKFTELCDSHSSTYASYMDVLKSKANLYFAFKDYPSDMQRYIYTTNAVESFNSMVNRVRLIGGGFFQSLKTLEVNIYLIRQRLKRGKWKNSIPNLKKFQYEINQILSMKFN